MRQTVIAGNWKMNGTLSGLEEYLGTVIAGLPASLSKKIWLALPYTFIFNAAKKTVGTPLQIGAQNVSAEDSGAFTGEISCSMLKEVGAVFTLVGHSERRHIFHESDEMIRKKTKKAVDSGLQTVLCIGETLDERESGMAETVLERQLKTALKGLSPDNTEKLLIAYEPVWAIGTSLAATPEQASSMHGHSRKILEGIFDKKTAARIPIIYGGSVKPDNIAALSQKEEIDGALIGGACLDPLSFLQIIRQS